MLPNILRIFTCQWIYHTIWWPIQPGMPPMPKWHCDMITRKTQNATSKDKAIKNRPLSQGSQHLQYLGATERDLCSIRGILPYLALRDNCSGPLLMLSDGKGLTQHLFKAALDNLLSALNMDKGENNTHSFHIGAPTSAKQANILNTYIQMLRHWTSDTWQHYIKTPPQVLAKLSKHITEGYPFHEVVSNSKCRHPALPGYFQIAI